MRNISWIIILCVLGLLASTSCQKEPEKKAPAAPAEEREFIFKADDIIITMNDYERCIDVHRFMGREYSARALANTRFQRDEIQRCYQSNAMRRHIAESNAEYPQALIQQAISKAMEREGVQSEDALAAKLKFDVAYVRELAKDSVMPQVMQRILASTIPAESVKKLYVLDNTRYHIELLDFNNEPNEEEIRRFLKEEEEVFKAYLEMHSQQFRTKPIAKFVRIAYSQTGGTEDALGHQQAEALRLKAVRDGADAALESCKADAKNGCIVLNDAENLYEVERTEETAWAFRLPFGGVSELINTPVQTEIWILKDVVPPRPLNLGDDSVRVKVAADVMKDIVAAPHLITEIREKLEGNDPDLEAIARNSQGNYKVFKDVSYMELVENKQIDNQNILNLLTTINDNETGLFSNPMMGNGRLYILRVISTKHPTDSEFAAGKDAWIEHKKTDPTLGMVNNWLQNKQPKISTVNIKPIQTKYGILQPNGTIR